MRLYNKILSREVRHLWQFNAKLAEECRVLRLKIAERTEERDELISSIFKMQGMINRCYCHMDKMSDIAVGVDTLYKRRKRDDEDEEEGEEKRWCSTDSASCSCDGGHSDDSDE